MSLVRKDESGLFVRTGGYVFRPGPINGYSHAFDMDDAGLSEGDQVKAKHRGGSTLANITLSDGTRRVWAEDYEHNLNKGGR